MSLGHHTYQTNMSIGLQWTPLDTCLRPIFEKQNTDEASGLERKPIGRQLFQHVHGP